MLLFSIIFSSEIAHHRSKHTQNQKGQLLIYSRSVKLLKLTNKAISNTLYTAKHHL